MLTWREVWAYIQLLFRWSPVLLIAVALSVGTAWYLTEDTPDYYVAQSSVMVGNNFTSNTPNSVSVDLSNALADYYAVLMRREVIMGPVVERLGLDLSWEYITIFMLSSNVNTYANLLEIRITDSSPERAAALANAIADQLIAYSPNSPEKVAAEREEIERQLGETQALINDLDQKIQDLETRQGALSSAIDLRDITDQIDKFKLSRESYQSTYNDLLLLRESSTANSLSIFERAKIPTTTLPQRRVLVLGIAGLGALILAIAAVLVLDLLDTRWRPDRDLEGRIGVKNLGRVQYTSLPGFGPGSKDARERQREVREAYTNLVLHAQSNVPRAVLVSSPRPSESRSAFAIDLAGVYAQSGLRVLLVDAELAKPHVTRLLLNDEQAAQQPPAGTSEGALELWSNVKGRSYNLPPELWLRLRPTSLINVALLPSHHNEPDALPLLVPSLHWPELIQSLRQSADIVIFDGPSILTGADSALLAPLMDGVVLALNPATDSRAEIAASKSRLLTHAGTRLVGAVTVEQSGPRLRERFAGRGSPPRSAKRRNFGISLSAQGITLNLPSKREAPTLTDDRPQEAVRPRVEPKERAVGDVALMERAVGDVAPMERAVGDVAPDEPPAAQVIVTPPPVQPLITPIAEPQAGPSTSQRPRAGGASSRGETWRRPRRARQSKAGPGEHDS